MDESASTQLSDRERAMIEAWRSLLYPLGFIASIAFGGRFLLQWITSEVQQRSVVSRAFWRLSLLGNGLLLIHSFLQLQFHVCVIQVCNGIIAWRNLDLLKPYSQQVRFQTVVQLIAGLNMGIFLLFILQGWFFTNGEIIWFRLPTSSWNETPAVGWLWHMIGVVGLFLFSSRFWIQWWAAEQKHYSYFSPAFWWLSLLGGSLSILYFIRIEDPVNLIGPLMGLVPYIRNLMLISKERSTAALGET